LPFYCIFEHQFFAKILEFPKNFFFPLKNLRFLAKSLENLGLKTKEIKNFTKILLVNLGFGRSLAKSCWNSSIF